MVIAAGPPESLPTAKDGDDENEIEKGNGKGGIRMDGRGKDGGGGRSKKQKAGPPYTSLHFSAHLKNFMWVELGGVSVTKRRQNKRLRLS